MKRRLSFLPRSLRQPLADLFIHFQAAEKVQMVDAVSHPLPRLRERQGARLLRMAPERGVERHYPVPKQSIAKIAGPSPGGSGDGVTLHSFRQRHRPPVISGMLEAVAPPQSSSSRLP